MSDSAHGDFDKLFEVGEEPAVGGNETAPPAVVRGVTLDVDGNPTKQPTPKVLAATTGAGVSVALTDLLVWGVETTFHFDIPANVELGIGVLIAAGLTFLASYFKRP